MNKHQTRAAQTIRAHAAIGNTHAAAAGLSALIRAALRASDRAELLELARELRVDNHPAFIVR